jgi:hypothetical protein
MNSNTIGQRRQQCRARSERRFLGVIWPELQMSVGLDESMSSSRLQLRIGTVWRRVETATSDVMMLPRSERDAGWDSSMTTSCDSVATDT